jgi:DNA-binding LacI/PurR family transcriptional regulator
MIDIGHPRVPHVVTDDVRGGEIAAEHLIARGHRRIGFVGDQPASPFGFTSSEHRREGFRRALRRAGIEPDTGLERRGRHGREEARVLAEDLLGCSGRPTAVFAASDTQALGVLEAAQSAGLSVPGDVAVIGFDDTEIAGAIGLSTVRQPLRESGARGADLLFAAITGGEAPECPLEPLAVVPRRTT